MPKISVIVPAYNCVMYIRATVNSILAQSELDLEILAVDDGSTDGTLAIIQQIAATDSRLHVISQANSGTPAAARNVGLSHARGQYVCFLDGDDLYHPEKLAQETAFLESHPDIVAVFHDMMYITAEGAEFSESYLEEVDFLKRATSYLRKVEDDRYLLSEQYYHFMSLYYVAAHTSSIMLRRTVVDELNIRFAEDVTVGEDTEAWWQIAHKKKLGYIDRVLSYYRQHDGSVTRNRKRYFGDLISVHSRNFFKIKQELSHAECAIYQHRIAEMWASLAYVHSLAGEFDKARHAYLKMVVWGSWARGLKCYAKTCIKTALRPWFARTAKS